jgi:hypothetical protein
VLLVQGCHNERRTHTSVPLDGIVGHALLLEVLDELVPDDSEDMLKLVASDGFLAL